MQNPIPRPWRKHSAQGRLHSLRDRPAPPVHRNGIGYNYDLVGLCSLHFDWDDKTQQTAKHLWVEARFVPQVLRGTLSLCPQPDSRRSCRLSWRLSGRTRRSSPSCCRCSSESTPEPIPRSMQSYLYSSSLSGHPKGLLTLTLDKAKYREPLPLKSKLPASSKKMYEQDGTVLCSPTVVSHMSQRVLKKVESSYITRSAAESLGD